jgi:hypothetical protein
MNGKNMALSPAATDLGLGAGLQQQLQDETEEQKKKRKLQQMTQMGQASQSLLGNTGVY